MLATFVTDEGLDVLVLALYVFSDVSERVTKKVTYSTLIVALTIMPGGI